MSCIHPSQISKPKPPCTCGKCAACLDRRLWPSDWKDSLYACCACNHCDLCLNHGGYKRIIK